MVRLRGIAVSLTAAVLLCISFAASSGAASLQVGSDVSGAPFEYYPAKSKAALGFDIDLLQALSAKLNSPVSVVNHQFDDLIPSVRAGKFDFAMSAMSDTSAREKLVDFVDYFVAGGGIMVPAGNPNRIFFIDALCGYSVTVEQGTSYASDLQKQSKGCEQVGLAPIKLLLTSTDDQAYAAFLDGKATAYVADYPVSVYRAKYANGGKKLEVVGKPFDVVPYGIALSKQNAALRDKLQAALLAVVADGTYDRLLKKWGLDLGALRFAPINAGVRYEHGK